MNSMVSVFLASLQGLLNILQTELHYRDEKRGGTLSDTKSFIRVKKCTELSKGEAS